MPSWRSRGRLRRLLVALAAVAVFLLGACSSEGSGAEGDGSDAATDVDTETATTAPIRTEVSAAGAETIALGLDGPHLAVVIDEGGRCEVGTCVRVLEFTVDGAWLLTDSDGRTAEGGFDASVLADLARDSRDADINLGPFQGECPTAFDGSERTYLVYSPDDPTTTKLDLASCRDQIDANAPIMVTLDLLALEASR